MFGETVVLEKGDNRLVINSTPDAIFFSKSDTLIFQNLATISSIFPGIDQLFKEAANADVQVFLESSFIKLDSDFGLDKVSKNNRKRIGLATVTLSSMTAVQKKEVLDYISEYCKDKLDFDDASEKFNISTDDELKLLIYGIEQRFYTTRVGSLRRLANSVQPM